MVWNVEQFCSSAESVHNCTNNDAVDCDKCREEGLLANILLDAGYYSKDAAGAFAACLAINLDYTFMDKMKKNSCVFGDRDYCCLVLGDPKGRYIKDLGLNNVEAILQKVFDSEYIVKDKKYPVESTSYIGIVPVGKKCSADDRYNCRLVEKCEITPYHNEFCVAYTYD